MSEKINQLVCPTCGLVCYTRCAYTTCDGCQTMFYASESAHHRPEVRPTVVVTEHALNWEQP